MLAATEPWLKDQLAQSIGAFPQSPHINGASHVRQLSPCTTSRGTPLMPQSPQLTGRMRAASPIRVPQVTSRMPYPAATYSATARDGLLATVSGGQSLRSAAVQRMPMQPIQGCSSGRWSSQDAAVSPAGVQTRTAGAASSSNNMLAVPMYRMTLPTASRGPPEAQASGQLLTSNSMTLPVGATAAKPRFDQLASSLTLPVNAGGSMSSMSAHDHQAPINIPRPLLSPHITQRALGSASPQAVGRMVRQASPPPPVISACSGAASQRGPCAQSAQASPTQPSVGVGLGALSMPTPIMTVPGGIQTVSNAESIRPSTAVGLSGTSRSSQCAFTQRASGRPNSKAEPLHGGPPDSRSWTAMERDLYSMSGGAYNPTDMAKMRRIRGDDRYGGTGVELEVRGRVSIVAPSMATRQHYHENLWRCFDAQLWPDKELVVVETYENSPSAFLKAKARSDRRIVHVVIQRSAGADFTVGLKRNMTLHLASGEFVVNFDDDDLYAPRYVQQIVGQMQAKNLVGVTLSSWYNYYMGWGTCTFSDPSGWDEWADDEDELTNILYGYGFSYTHRRRPALSHPYPNVGFAEDAPFFLKLRELFGDDKVILWRDDAGLCMHIMHRANTALVLGSRNVSAMQIASLAVTDLKPFQKMIDSDFFRFSPWRPPVRLPAASVDIPVAGCHFTPVAVPAVPADTPADSIELPAAGGFSASIPTADVEDDDDVRPRLLASTLGVSPEDVGAAMTAMARPRANTWRNTQWV